MIDQRIRPQTTDGQPPKKTSSFSLWSIDSLGHIDIFEEMSTEPNVPDIHHSQIRYSPIYAGITMPLPLNYLTAPIADANFSSDLLAVESPLWGTFWQFDVIAPGSRLPVGEVALLRAMRLDRTWPEETTVEQFLADLRGVAGQPQAGVYTLTLGETALIVVAGYHPSSGLLTVVWYSPDTGRLHAGYRTPRLRLVTGPGIVEHRPLPTVTNPPPLGMNHDWLAEVIAEKEAEPTPSLAARLDLEILRWRL